MTDTTWHDQGICATTDPAIFYPEPGASDAPALEICAGCPIRRTCLQHALTAPEWHGVWGGVSQNERRRLIRARQAQAA
jgi:WhiB family redox-sensing transcriptional regulator